MKNHRWTPSIALVLLCSGLAACLDDDTGPHQKQSPTDEYRQVVERYLVGGSKQIIVLEPAENKSIAAHYIPPTPDRFNGSALPFCESAQQDGEGNYFWINIWNRTGLAYYQEWPMEWKENRTFTAEWPDDPPFLLWVGMTCLERANIEFHAKNWFLTSPPALGRDQINATEEEFEEPLIVYKEYRKHKAVIPTGSTQTTVINDLQGDSFFNAIGPAPGRVERISGNRYGTIHEYPPDREPGVDNWTRMITFDPFGRDWQLPRGETGTPGPWKYVFTLDTPAVTETVWTIEMHVAYFLPRIQEFGFEFPFKVHDTRWLEP